MKFTVKQLKICKIFNSDFFKKLNVKQFNTTVSYLIYFKM